MATINRLIILPHWVRAGSFCVSVIRAYMIILVRAHAHRGWGTKTAGFEPRVSRPTNRRSSEKREQTAALLSFFLWWSLSSPASYPRIDTGLLVIKVARLVNGRMQVRLLASAHLSLQKLWFNYGRSRDFALHNRWNSQMAYIAVHLNTEIILVVTV